MAVTSTYYELLHSLEEDDLLDPSDSLHLFCAQYVFVPRLQMDLDVFTDGWDNHPLRTEQNLTPNQLWSIGLLQNPVPEAQTLEVNENLKSTKLCSLESKTKQIDEQVFFYILLHIQCCACELCILIVSCALLH